MIGLFRHILFAVASLFTGASVFGQTGWSDWHFGIGNSIFLGELGGKPTLGTNDPRDLDYQSMRFSLSAGFKRMFGQSLGVRVVANYARVSGNDKYTTNPERNQRNLSFFSPIIEGYAALEVYPGEAKRFYAFLGAGLFYFEPKAELGGTVYNLRDYGTEGQYFLPDKEPYKPTSLVIPFGVGYRIKENIFNRHCLRVEFVFHKSTTDYIDDVSTQYVDKSQLANRNGQVAVQLMDRSQSSIPGFSEPGAIRGDPRDNDNFCFMQFVYTMPIGKSKVGQGFGGKRKRSSLRRVFWPGSF